MPQPQQLAESTNGQFNTRKPLSSSSYPPATARFEDVFQSSDLFWEKLQAFHKSLGNKFKIPVVGGKSLDLHRLFVEVTSRGGIEKVMKDRIWKDVIIAFHFPTTITSASFVLRKYYLSLLYPFEQVYYFRKQVPSALNAMNLEHVAEAESDEGVASETRLFGMWRQNTRLTVAIYWRRGPWISMGPPLMIGEGTTELQPGAPVTGLIDGKFDNGYLVTVKLGSDELSGVLYHVPQAVQLPMSSCALDAPRRRRKRSRSALRDPSQPKSNRSGYNFFFQENYARLKPMYYGQEKTITKMIGHQWNNLSDAEKKVYQEKGVKDKERYKAEMLQYKSTYDTTPQ